MIPGLRRTLKAAAERLLVGSGLPSLARKRQAGRCVILALHNVLPAGQLPAGDRPLHLPVNTLERFLDALVTTHDVVGLDELASPATGDRPRAAITIDDAYAGALSYGLPALAARGLPATVFVAPGLLGRPACWWDRLADPVRGLDETVRAHALGTLRGDDEAIMRWAAATGRPSATSPHWRIATQDELASAARQRGVTLGAHSWSHANLAALSAAELGAETEKPLSWLQQRFPSVRPWLAYPYGLSSALVARSAEQAGYALGFLVAGGWVTTVAGQPWQLPRWSVSSGLSDRGFVLRAAGVIAE